VHEAVEAGAGPTAGERRSWGILLGLLLVALTFVAYRPTLGSGFLAWDDPDVVALNPYVTGENPSGFFGIFTDRIFLTWLPLYFLSLRIDHLFFGLAPFGYHLTNLLLHLVNAFLVLAVAGRLTGRREVAWGAAFLFALHPAATESVAWIAERKGLVAFLFAALAILAFLRAIDAKGLARRAAGHLLGALLLFLALTAKGSALVVPLILALYVVSVRWPERRWRWLGDLLPYAAVGCALALVHYSIAVDEGPALVADGAPLGTLVATDVPVLSRYLRTLFLPLFGQSLVPDVRPVSSAGPVILGLAVLGLYAAGLVAAFRRDRLLFFALAAAPLALAPFNNVLPRTTVLFAERYLYIPVAAAALAGALLLARTGRFSRYALAGVTALLLVLTLSRTVLWSDGIGVFCDAEEKAGESWLASMKHGESAAIAARAGAPERFPDAEAAFRRALERTTDLEEEIHTRISLTEILRETPGREQEVLDMLDPVLARIGELPPRAAERARHSAGMARGLALFLLDRIADAMEAYRSAARADPTDPDALAEYAVCLARLGRLREASEIADEALGLAPDHESAVVVRAEIAVLGGDAKRALSLLGSFLEHRPDSVRALCLGGELSLAAARPKEARGRFVRALGRSPGLERAVRGIAESDLLLSRAAFSQGKTEVARALAQLAADRLPEDPLPLVFLAELAPDRATAEEFLRRAAELPGGQGARDSLGALRVRGALARLDKGDEKGAAGAVASAVRAEPRTLRLGAGLVVRGAMPKLTELAAAPVDTPGREALLLGLARLLEGKHSAAQARLTDAYRSSVAGGRTGPVGPLALLLRGRARLEDGDRTGALDDFSVLAGLEKEDPWPLLYKAETLCRSAILEQSRALAADEVPDVEVLFDGARGAARRAMALAPDLLEAELRLGEIEFAAGAYVESLRVFTAIKRKHPDRVEPMLDLASLYRTHFMITEDRAYLAGARDELEQALAIDPGHARAHAALGEILLILGHARKAAVELMRAVAADPALVEPRETLAGLYVREGGNRLDRGGAEGPRGAEEFAQRAIALGTKKAGAHLLLLNIARGRKDYESGQVHLERAMELEPGSAEVKDVAAAFHKEMGYAFLFSARRETLSPERSRRYRERAFGEFRKAIEAGSEREDLKQVRILLGLEEPDPGGEPLEPRVAEILRERAEKARGHFEASGRLWAAGDIEGADREIHASLDALVTAEAYYRLARLRTAQDRRADAVKAYRSAVRAKPSLAAAWLNLGGLLYFEGDLAGAVLAYEGWRRRAKDPDRATWAKVEAMVEEMKTTLEERK